MDEITKAYVAKLEEERDAAIEHAAELELDLQEANEIVTSLMVQLRQYEYDRTYVA